MTSVTFVTVLGWLHVEAAVAYLQLLLTQPWKSQPRKTLFGQQSKPGSLKEEADSINTSQPHSHRNYFLCFKSG